MLCKICGQDNREEFSAEVLGKYSVPYFYCSNCGFLQSAEPYWLAEAYQNPINDSDTGQVARNLSLARRTGLLWVVLFDKRDQFLDYAGGYGLLVRILRDWGWDFYWSDKYAQNIFAPGFAYAGQPVRALTCFECFEHFVDPIAELEKMLELSSTIFFSTLLFDMVPPAPSWWYYGFEHGQHISFYSLRTLRFLAAKYGLNLYSNGRDLHLLTKKKIPSWFFKLLMHLGRWPVELLFRWFLPSRTLADHDYLVGRSGR